MAKNIWSSKLTIKTPSEPTVVIKMMDALRKLDGSMEQDQDPLRKRLRFDESSFLSEEGSLSRGASALDTSRAVKEKEAEIVNLKARITNMEIELLSLQNKVKERGIEYDALQDRQKLETKSYKEKLELQEEIIDNLKQERDEFCEKMCELEDRVGKESNNFDSEKVVLEQEIHKLERDNTELTEQVKILLQEFEREAEELKQKRKQSELDMKEEIEKLKLKLASTENRPTSASLEAAEMDLSRANQKINELELELSREKENLLEVVPKEKIQMWRKMEKYCERMQAENELFRDAFDENSVLREKVDNLEHQLKLSNSRATEYEVFKVKTSSQEQHLELWEHLVVELGCKGVASGTQGVHFVKKYINHIQSRSTHLADELFKLRPEINASQRRIQELEQQITHLKIQVEKEKEANNKLQGINRKLKNKLVLFSTERDGYKNILETYESELTVNVGVVDKQRIQQLENMLQSYRETAMEEVDVMMGEKNPDVNYQEKISELETRVKELQTENTQIKEELERKSLQTQEEAEKYIIQLEDNPAAKAYEKEKNRVTSMQKEIMRLKGKIVQLQQDAEATVSESMISNSSDVVKLKKELETTNKRQKKLVETYAKKSKEFRNAVYLVTGYRVDVHKANQYRLRHLYDQGPNSEIVIEKHDDEDLMLLATDYLNEPHVQELMDTVLTDTGSIPCFLGALTNTLFEKQQENVDSDDVAVLS